MERLFTKISEALARGEDLVLCTIIASSGSTPRGSGAKMAVFADGSSAGTVGGGAVEFESIQLARKALTERSSFTHGFNLAKNQVADIGMICGGAVVVYFQFFAGADEGAKAFFARCVALFGEHKNSWLITRIADGGVQGMSLFEEEAGLLFGADLDAEALRPLLKAQALLKSQADLKGSESSLYVEPLTRAETVTIFGGGHVAQELVPVLAHLGFLTRIFEDREAFCDPALFPGAVGTIFGDFGDIYAKVAFRPADYVIIMTRGHQADFEVLNQVLRSELSYIGLIGSRSKIAATRARLIEAGHPAEAFERVCTPIGLDIAAETPAEIAISIAGELIMTRAGRPRKCA